jgi:hypothetical protein
MSYKVGDRVQIKTSVSKKGKYGKYAGQVGTINIVQWDTLRKITLDNGDILEYVGQTVVEPYVKKSVKTFLDKKKALEEELKEINDILEYIEDTGTEEFDPTEYKVFRTLKAFKETGLTDIEKAKKIAELIKA